MPSRRLHQSDTAAGGAAFDRSPCGRYQQLGKANERAAKPRVRADRRNRAPHICGPAALRASAAAQRERYAAQLSSRDTHKRPVKQPVERRLTCVELSNIEECIGSPAGLRQINIDAVDLPFDAACWQPNSGLAVDPEVRKVVETDLRSRKINPARRRPCSGRARDSSCAGSAPASSKRRPAAPLDRSRNRCHRIRPSCSHPCCH